MPRIHISNRDRVVATTIIVLIFLLIATLVFWARVPTSISDMDCTLSGNAAWISVDWTSQPVDVSQVHEFASDATRRRLRYLYPFVTYVREDGSFSPGYGNAIDFVAAFREVNQDSQLLAWVGVPVLNERRYGIHGWVNLAESADRERIVDFSMYAVNELGFDGIHLNVEHVDSGDAGYLLLLEETAAALGSDHTLSVAANDWLPAGLNWLPGLGGYKWDSAYYQAVAEHVDQIATMTYDSFMPTPALYSLWLREQVVGVGRALSDSDTEWLVGISVSREKTRTHRPEAENMGAGIAGACAGAARSRLAGLQGIAVYAAWEADQNDWLLWEQTMTGNQESTQ